MKITQLHLVRYGHLSGVKLAFDPHAPLQIVLGANEAGKSTALAAIADALFGFPHRTNVDFLHAAKDLRVGIGLRAADGQETFFIRRKGRQDTLLDATETPTTESALANYLGGNTRDRFAEFFGMDGITLRRGGAAILEGRGEVGESIALAFSRRHDVRGALARLNDQALALYGPRRGERAIHLAIDNFKRARQDLEDRSIRPADYERVVRERETCTQARAKNAAESAYLETEREKLDRIRRTTPARIALQNHIADLAALGDTKPLPPDAETRRLHALQRREIAARALEREAKTQAEETATLQTLAVDEKLLAEAATIDALAADLNRISGAIADRQTQTLQAAQAQDRMRTTGARLGLALDAETLAARMPTSLVRAAAQRAIGEHTKLATRAQQFAADLERAKAALAAASAALAETPPPAPVHALIEAIDAARAESRLDSTIAEAQDDAAAAARTIQATLKNLPFWSGTAETLAKTPLPLAADIARAEAALNEAATHLAEKRQSLATHTQSLKTVAAELAGFHAAGAPPTQSALAAARARRDHAWQLIRHHHIDGGPPPPGSEHQNLPEAFAALIAEADALADRIAAEAERVAAYQLLLGTEARTRSLRETAETNLARAAEHHAAAQETWRALWALTGITPAEPAAMREWRTRREAVLAALDAADRKQAALDRLNARHETTCQTLAACLPTPDSAAKNLAKMLRAAERLRAAHDDSARRHAENSRTVTEAERVLQNIDATRLPLDRDFAAWHTAWAPIAAGLGLPPQTGPDTGADALAIWADLDRDATEWRRARERIAEMTAAIAAFETRASACRATCAPNLDPEPIQAAIRVLAKSLAQTRAAATHRADLEKRIFTRAAALKTLAADHAAAEDELRALRTLAAAETDEALATAIARATQAADLREKIATRQAELENLADGLTAQHLAAEAEAIHAETLPARIAEIDERRRAIADENEFLAKTVRDLETSQHAMEHGNDAAEAAQRMQDEAAAAEEAAARFVKLRLAHTLLRAGIDRFRREQQAPLLAAASTLFAALTENRYRRLALDEEEDGKMVVVAERPDGTHCPADRLSEGTRDQLFLALRLAAIKTQEGRSDLLPFIADDLLASFDDIRAKAALHMLKEFGQTTQTILFTHHAHLAAMAHDTAIPVHTLP